MPDNNNKDNLFSGLENLGFKNLDDVKLYQEKKEPETEQKSTTQEKSIKDMIFDRKVFCPICAKQITVKAVRFSAIRTVSRDTDFMTNYKDPNPAFYDAWACFDCGYSALSNKFSSISEKQIKLVKQHVTAKWSPKKAFPDVYTVDNAIELHQLALLNAVVKGSKDSEKAMICLKTAWLYRIKKDDINEKKYLSNALEGFLKTLEIENFPVAGLDEPSLQYLIGELYRRTGDDAKALSWFSKSIVHPMAKPKIKDMIRDQRDLIKSK